ncbi:MAG: hypothetical protein AB8B77_03415 [Alphaproteobacteria bacterium]
MRPPRQKFMNEDHIQATIDAVLSVTEDGGAAGRELIDHYYKIKDREQQRAFLNMVKVLSKKSHLG